MFSVGYGWRLLHKRFLLILSLFSIVLPYAGACLVVPGKRSLLITRSDMATRRRVMSRVVCLRPLRHLSPRLSQAKAARDRDERSVRAAHAARPDLVTIKRARWCLPPAAQYVILQSCLESSGPGVLAPEVRSASVSSRGSRVFRSWRKYRRNASLSTVLKSVPKE